MARRTLFRNAKKLEEYVFGSDYEWNSDSESSSGDFDSDDDNLDPNYDPDDEAEPPFELFTSLFDTSALDLNENFDIPDAQLQFLETSSNFIMSILCFFLYYFINAFIIYVLVTEGLNAEQTSSAQPSISEIVKSSKGPRVPLPPKKVPSPPSKKGPPLPSKPTGSEPSSNTGQLQPSITADSTSIALRKLQPTTSTAGE